MEATAVIDLCVICRKDIHKVESKMMLKECIYCDNKSCGDCYQTSGKLYEDEEYWCCEECLDVGVFTYCDKQYI